VLWIDDDAGTLDSSVRLLTAEGFAVEQATSGAAGLTLARSRSYGAILLDLRLPDMPGLEVLKQLRARHIDTSVLIVTGYRDIEAAVEAGRLGVAGMLLKPSFGDEFVSAVRRAVSTTRTQEPNASGPCGATPPKCRSLTRRAEELIRARPRLRLAEIARAFGMDRHEFEARIRSETGQQFRTWRLGILMEAAAEMMRNSDRALTEIAWEVGYRGHNPRRSFSRTFRAVFGISPTQYRRRVAGKPEQEGET
jgi:YesN/AraC family two-component response regulator